MVKVRMIIFSEKVFFIIFSFTFVHTISESGPDSKYQSFLKILTKIYLKSGESFHFQPKFNDMETNVLGGQTDHFSELFHYTNSNSISSILPGKYWTSFKTIKSSDAKRMTGSTNDLNYRVTVRVKSDAVYKYFSDAGTKWGPIGLGAAYEYRNKDVILNSFCTIDKMV